MQPTTPSPDGPAVQRSDARRNRARILSAARTAFATPEANASLAEISRRADVGMATLYRNFPSRRELLEALYAAEVDEVCAAAQTASGESPGDALRAWLHQCAAFAAGKKQLAAELLMHVDRDNPVFNDNRARVLAAGQPLFDAAQRSRQVRTDLTLAHVLDMLVSIAGIEGGASYHKPIVETVLDGLAPPTLPADVEQLDVPAR